MSKASSITLVVIALVVLAGGLFFLGTMFGRFSPFGAAPAFGVAGGPDYAYGPMMGGYGPGTMNRQHGPGMMDGPRGFGMMGGAGGPGMMGGYRYTSANTAPLTVKQARAAAEEYLSALNNSDLAIAEIMILITTLMWPSWRPAQARRLNCWSIRLVSAYPSTART
jgi:hypothetical protein